MNKNQPKPGKTRDFQDFTYLCLLRFIRRSPDAQNKTAILLDNLGVFLQLVEKISL